MVKIEFGMMIAIKGKAHQQNSKISLSSSPESGSPPFLMSGSIFLTMPSWTLLHDGMRLLSAGNFILGNFFVNRIRKFIDNAGERALAFLRITFFLKNQSHME